MSDSPDFLYEKKGPIAVMTWNRPDRRNCFTPRMIDDYYAALDDFNRDPELRVVVVASTGEQAWCSGGDLDAMIPAITSGEWKINEDPTKRIYSDIFKPIICAVNGFVGLLLGKIMALVVIAFPFIFEAGTSLIQILSKKFFKKKIFAVAPFHLWLQNKGWEEPKIVQRAWLAGIMLAIFGLWLAVI